ncbi:Hypothetical predicted protein [Marmota monax]|uniref:Ig-like domain-containing protein n=1 Tax=Marmota monax TaxID=9995 RepID=A0A5E4CBA9_MARMO|nr:hypothetical protein GHT09_005579 [Marmota monax]VTJ79234.1 Hypothetical predicted protein [Marmota monax]
MGVCGYLFLPWKCLVVVSLRLLFLVPTGVPVRSGDATFPKAMDNVTVRQGESATLRCTIDNRVTRVAWLNRSTILYAGNDKWCLDPRVVLLSNTQTQYSIEIQNVDVYDEGPYTCSVQTDNHPKTSRVHLIVQVSPKIVEISSDISINEGNNISLTCIATGRPEPTVTWRHISPKGKRSSLVHCILRGNGRLVGYGQEVMVLDTECKGVSFWYPANNALLALQRILVCKAAMSFKILEIILQYLSRPLGN